MDVRVVCGDGVELLIGQIWTIEVRVTDENGYVTDDETPTIVVTLPAGTTASPAATRVATGLFRFTHAVGSAGRYVAVVTATGYGTAAVAAWVGGTTAGTAMPTVDDLLEYPGISITDEVQLQDALDSEAAAQRAVCRVGAVYPADLRQALLRRVACNLVRRKLPLNVLQGDAELGAFPPARDPEVRRLEGPHRKLIVG